MNKNTKENVLFDRIKQSVGKKQPVLIKLSLGDLWGVITGYNDDKNLPCIMKSRRSPQPDKDWYNKLSSIVFITDKYDSALSLPESLDHMIRHLNTANRNKLEKKIYQKLDQAWKIWGLLGVSPETFYCLPRNINELLDSSSVRTELKSLFKELFTIDRQVSDLLQECLSLL